MARRLPALWVPPTARDQGGLFTVRQALEAGASVAQVRRRRETGRWRRVVGDALALADVRIDPWLEAQAVALTWPDAVVALTSAAKLHRLPVDDDGFVHLIVPRRVRRRPGVVTHELRLGRDDVVRAGRSWVTSRQRTLFDCIGRSSPAQAERLTSWAVTREVIDPVALERATDDRPRWWGNTNRRQALDDLAAGTLSAAERRLRAVLRTAGISGWQFDQQVHDAAGLIGRADVLFRAERLVVEVDGFASHARIQFQHDRTKQNRLVAAGFTVLRFTWADLTERPDDVARQIRALLHRLRTRP